jgi:hypothetical protein
MKTLTVATLLIVSAGLSTAQAAVFGDDNHSKLSTSSPLNVLGQATAITLMRPNYEINSKGGLDLNTTPLTNFCSDESFYGEQSLSYSCTGFLVGPDLLVTAGHCMYAINTANGEIKNEPGKACEVFDWLFDFQTSEKGETQTKDIPSDRLYHCKQIIYATELEKAPFSDYALIQLDRPVVGRTPLVMSAKPVINGSVNFMIGHPFGTSTKLTNNGSVIRNNPTRTSFITNLDAFEGNSGSPVFNTANEVIGILISGTPSANTYLDKKNNCERVNRCDQNGQHCREPDLDSSKFPEFQVTGSEVQRISPLVELIKNLAPKH